MNYPEMCALLEQELGKAEVFDRRYPELGSRTSEAAQLILWAHGDVFEVGGAERGRFIATYRFSSESEACEYLLRALRLLATRPAPQTEAEKEESLRITESTNESLRQRFGSE